VDLSFLPTLNAMLNSLAAGLLLVGRQLARQRRVVVHRRVMSSAFGVSTLFLLFYVIHKAWRGFEHTPFHAEGPAQVAYLVLLFSHLVLAIAVPPLALAMITLGVRGRVTKHRRLARWAWPVWMYVSVTGVAIYMLLYHLNPPAA
jgi:putative membrane protein